MLYINICNAVHFVYNIKINFIYSDSCPNLFRHEFGAGGRGAWESNTSVCCDKYKFSLSYLEY